MAKWIVTGGEGFIGGKIVGVAGADSFDLKSGKDVLDTEKLAAASSGADGIFHCAALIIVPESFEKPEVYYRNNVHGTASVIRAIPKSEAKVVFSSSAAVYGENDRPVAEDDPLSPQSPYAENKRDGEALLQASGVPAVILRYFNVYGPGQPDSSAGIITSFIQAALKGEDLVIFGDGEQVRDFIYIDDVVRANIAAMESEFHVADVFNIGSGIQTSIRQLAEEVIERIGSSSSIRFEAPREGDIRYSQADVGKAARLLRWKAEVGLREGLERTIGSYS